MFKIIFVNVDFVLMFKTMFLTPDEYRKIDSFMLLHFGAVVKPNHYAAHSQRQISQFVTLFAVGAMIVVKSLALKNLRDCFLGAPAVCSGQRGSRPENALAVPNF